MMLDCQYNANGFEIAYCEVVIVMGDKNDDIDDYQ
jgi:hypothetical protein